MLVFILVLLALLTATAVFCLIVSWKVSSMLLFPKVYAYETVVEEEIKRGHFTREWFDETVLRGERWLPLVAVHCLDLNGFK